MSDLAAMALAQREIDHFRRRATALLSDLTGVDPLDPRLVEFVECMEATAVAVIAKRLASKRGP